MNIRFAAAGALAVALLAVSATSASAQTTRPSAPPSSASSSSLPPVALEGSINLGMRVLNRGVSTTYTPGWSFGGSIHATSVINVIAADGADYNSTNGLSSRIYTYGGGVRFQSPASKPRINPYMQVMLGGAHDNGLANGHTDGLPNYYPFVSPGGGADFKFSSHGAVRVMLDFPLYMTFGDVYKGLRFSTGVVVPVAGK